MTDEPILAEGLAVLLDAEPGLCCESVPSDLISALTLLEDGKVEALVVDESQLGLLDLDRITGALGSNTSGCLVLLTSGATPSDRSVVGALGSRGRSVDKRCGTATVIGTLLELLA